MRCVFCVCAVSDSAARLVRLNRKWRRSMRFTVINSSERVKLFAFFLLSLLASGQEVRIGNSLFEISVREGGGTLWTLNLRGSDRLYRFSPPVFEIDGQSRVAVPIGLREMPVQQIGNGITERRVSGS